MKALYGAERKKKDNPMGYTKEELRAMLPKVGDWLVKAPHLHKSLGIEDPKPQPCQVLYVNEAHCWYMVRYKTGLRERYKVPEPTRKGGRLL